MRTGKRSPKRKSRRKKTGRVCNENLKKQLAVKRTERQQRQRRKERLRLNDKPKWSN